MTTLTAHAIIENGRMTIDLPTTLPAGEMEVEIRVHDSAKPRGTDIQAILALAGKLEWDGDPVKMQRELRDEWPD